MEKSGKMIYCFVIASLLLQVGGQNINGGLKTNVSLKCLTFLMENKYFSINLIIV
jgi:hypothetical protein